MKNAVTLTTALLVLASATAYGQLIIADDYEVTGSGTGFGPNAGVNSGINPPATRLTGSVAANMGYIQTATGKAATAYSIAGGKLQTVLSSGSGRFTFSNNGSTPYDFAGVLGIGTASPISPITYDITMSMANTVSGTTRFSFALSAEENNANFWDFGLQLYRAVNTDDFYQIGKRIDSASYTSATDGTGTTGDQNSPITQTAAGTYGDEINFLIRVTDAGGETGANYNSRVQVSMDNGSSWFYDTESDSTLTNGWRFSGSQRFLVWDQAGAASGTGEFTYDNLSLTIIPEPTTCVLGFLGGIAVLFLRRRF